jgi:cell division protein FtsB
MKKLLIIITIITILMTISFNANAGFLTGYVVGRGTKHCSCVNEKEQIEQLKKENDKLKDQINNLIKLLEKKYEKKENKTN